ncbi:diacylglycerol kinase [Halodesulfovibrio marinisediminis]|uniref:Diacylglycerol kinase n=1 Tax=Halodesulfovibrio marinisediminis DSM 17456 TaxID=1121457 RepID=A0A1N6F5M8_9BACT|nr:diacylglycerol kinase [Halodesulfovibrio marinisediminis]SIN90565.1 diacylglycerol kinase (ATP) [Halodesulfovibrio marinisediminis DSM 17456]
MPIKKFIETDVAHFFQASGYTMQGLIATYRSEIAFRQEVVLIPVILLVAWFFFGFPSALLLTGMWLIVCAFELCNSAIENIADLVMPENNDFIKRAKDAGSAAVGVAIVANVLAWLYMMYQ